MLKLNSRFIRLMTWIIYCINIKVQPKPNQSNSRYMRKVYCSAKYTARWLFSSISCPKMCFWLHQMQKKISLTCHESSSERIKKMFPFSNDIKKVIQVHRTSKFQFDFQLSVLSHPSKKKNNSNNNQRKKINPASYWCSQNKHFHLVRLFKRNTLYSNAISIA